SVATHSILGVFSGTSSYNTSTGTLNNFVVAKASSTTAVTVSPSSPWVFGQPVTFKATISPVSPSTLTPNGGTVSFYNGAAVAANLLGTSNVSSGVATLSNNATNTLSVTTHTITAVYSGDSSFKTSTGTFTTFTVGKANTTTALASTLNPSGFGDTVTFSATVSPVNPSSVTVNLGTVTFVDVTTSTTLGTKNVSSGVASLDINTLSLGSHTIKATYNS